MAPSTYKLRSIHVNNIEQYSELIAKYLAGEITPAETQDLFTWVEADVINKKFFDDAISIWGLAEASAAAPFETDLDKAWAKIESGIEKNAVTSPQPRIAQNYKSPKIIPLSKIIWRWSVAAAILLLLGVGFWWMNNLPGTPSFVEIQTTDHEKKEIILPDGSHVWLNQNSKLVYGEDFEERRLTLEGEAFFEVERMPDRPFEIICGNATTTVLGTSFNVRAYPGEDDVEVTVKTGKVKLAAAEKEKLSVLLSAGETGIFEKETANVLQAAKEISNADAWKTARFNFNEALVGDIILSLERYFDIEISVSNPLILNCHYSANFEKPELQAALQNLSFGLGLRMEKTNTGYLLSGKGCQPDN